MSRSPSPASSLDYFDSSGSASEDDYMPRSTRTRKVPQSARGAAGPSTSKGRKITLKLNLGAAGAAREVAVAHPAEGEVDEDDYEIGDEEGAVEGLMARRGADFSDQDLKRDHAARPLWVDEYGNMSVCHNRAAGTTC